jgi:transposase
VIYCLQPGLHGEEFEGSALSWCRLRVNQKCVVRTCGHRHGVAREGCEFCEQGLEAVDRQAVVGALGGGLATRSLGALSGSDDGGSCGGSLGALMIVEQVRSERLAHVPLEIVGEHAQQHMGADPIGQAMVDRSDLEIDGLDRTEGTLGLAQALVDPHDIAGSQRGFVKIGADDVEAIEFALGLDGIGVACEGKLLIGDGQDEVLGHLVAIEHGASGEADLVGPAQRLALAADGLGHLAQVGLGGGQQVQTFAGAFRREQGLGGCGLPSIDTIAGYFASGNGKIQGGQENQALGRSWGGFSSKIHLKTDFDGLPIAFHLTGGEVSDTTQLEISLDIGPDIAPRVAITDKGCDSAANRAACRRRGIIPVIPYRENAKNRPCFFPRLLYKTRARIEQTIGKLKRFKRIAMRCDKTQDSYGAFVAFACTLILVKSVHRT